MLTKRNHYLPQFYQEYFLPKKEPRIFWVYDKDGGEPRAQTPINTGIEGHLYTVINSDGSKDDSVERKILEPTESSAKPIIDRWLMTKSRIEDHDIPVMASFLALMHTRVPRTIEAAREIGVVLATYLMQELAKRPDEIRKTLTDLHREGKIERIPSVEEFQRMVENPEEKYIVTMNKKPALGMSLNSTEEIYKQLLSMRWCLCRAPRNINFITSDSPLVPFVLDKHGMATFGGGFALPNAEVTFPLSPMHCLYMDRRAGQTYRAVSEKVVKEINRRTAWMSERFIISTYKTRYVDNIVKASAVTRKMPKMDKKDLMRRFQMSKLFD